MKQIYVVEGRNDVTRLKQLYPNINIVSVNGSAINKDIVKLLLNRVDKYEIVLCMDPDYAGERIRKYLTKKLKVVTHIFINRKDAHNKNNTKIGFEHASNKVLKEAFSKHMKEDISIKSNITMSFLYDNGLIGKNNSKELRTYLSNELNIGHVNGKTLYNRLNSFKIRKKEVLNIIKRV